MGVSWHSHFGKPPGSNTEHTPPPNATASARRPGVASSLVQTGGQPQCPDRAKTHRCLTGASGHPHRQLQRSEPGACAEHTDRAVPLHPVSKQAGGTAFPGGSGASSTVGRAALGQAGVLCACPPHGCWAPGPQNNLPALLPAPPRAELWNPKPWRCLAPTPHPAPSRTHTAGWAF